MGYVFSWLPGLKGFIISVFIIKEAAGHFLSRAVHIVHGVHVRGRLDTGQQALFLELVDDVAHEGFGERQDIGNLAVGLALDVEVFDVEVAGIDVFFRAFLEVLPLRAGAQEAEVDKVVVVDDLAGNDVVGPYSNFPWRTLTCLM